MDACWKVFDQPTIWNHSICFSLSALISTSTNNIQSTIEKQKSYVVIQLDLTLL